MKAASAVALLCCLALAPAAQAKELRVFISADMEGIAGVVNKEQSGPEGFEYGLFRKLMTGEVNAAIDGALAAGATKITVADSHGNGLSLLPDELNPKARLIRSWPRPLAMMQGVEGGFDAVLLIGYHASGNTADAVLAHTNSGRRYVSVRLNGQHASEGLINAAIAGHYGVPVVLVSGDEAAVAEIQRTAGAGIAGVAVKRAVGLTSADSLSPEAAREQIRTAAEKALGKLGSVKPYQLSRPVRLEVVFKNILNAEVLAFLPVFERIDGATIAYTGRDMIEAARALNFIGNYDSNQ